MSLTDLDSQAGRNATRRFADLVLEDRVHQSLYVDAEIFMQEMATVFGRTWVYVAHESQVPGPNMFVRARLGLRPVVVTRDGRGSLHVLFNRCAHRAATVCREESGTAKSFQCPYHGWTFRNDGSLVGVPWPDGYDDSFRLADFSLGSAPRVESYRGFVFATLNEDAAPLVDHLGAATTWLDYWVDRSPTGEVFLRSGVQRMAYRGNWKLAFDNAGDGYHPAFSHRSLLKMAGRLGEPKDMTYFGETPDEGPMRLYSLGNGHSVLDQRPNYPNPGDIWRTQRPQPGREWVEEQVRSEYPDDADRLLDLCAGSQINLSIFPNLLIIGNQVQVVEPCAVDRTQLAWWATTIGGVPELVNRMRMRTQEDFPAFGEPDDQANFEEAQIGLGIAEAPWVLMNRGRSELTDVGGDGAIEARVTDEIHLRAYYREWLRLMEEC